MSRSLTPPMHLLIPMSGQGVRYQKAGYTEPKPMIPVNGIPMIERLLRSFPMQWKAHFVLAENHRESDLPNLLKKLRPDSVITFVPPHTQGPGTAIRAGIKNIPPTEPVLVSYCDYGMIWDHSQFEEFVQTTACDSCVICYRGFHAHYLNPQTYAYCRMDGEQVREIREKGSFTDDRENEYASSGGYYFRTAQLLSQALDYQTQNQLILNGESYTSLTVEALLRMKPQSNVRVFEIPAFFQWGTPQDLQNFEFWEKSYQAYLRFSNTPTEVDQVLMPMAGLGSRFQGITSDPKPLIPVAGVPMFQKALDSLPSGNKTVLVSLKTIEPALRPHLSSKTQLVSLDHTPSGQALSTEAGVAALESNREVLISSCDHAIVLDPSRWKNFRARPDCDAAIFTVRDYPGANRKPQAFAYVVPEPKDSNPFPSVQKVSVKSPVSTQPSKDALLVGTFWFKSAQVLQQGIDLLKKQDIRVNGELYLDSVFEILMKNGLKVRMIPLDGYLCYGDPDSLAEALYWYEVFCQRKIEKRNRFPGIQS